MDALVVRNLELKYVSNEENICLSEERRMKTNFPEKALPSSEANTRLKVFISKQKKQKKKKKEKTLSKMKSQTEVNLLTFVISVMKINLLVNIVFIHLGSASIPIM